MKVIFYFGYTFKDVLIRYVIWIKKLILTHFQKRILKKNCVEMIKTRCKKLFFFKIISQDTELTLTLNTMI